MLPTIHFLSNSPKSGSSKVPISFWRVSTTLTQLIYFNSEI